MTNTPRDPADAVRLAWSTFRLPVLQSIVDQTIAGLQQIEPTDLLGRPLSPVDRQLESNAIAAALEACSEELREESGMTKARERRLDQSQHVRQSMQEQPAAWTTTFQEALQKYRQAAGRALDRSLSAGLR
jgi:hypothetical protein